MQLFYTQNIQGNIAILGEEETRHCTKVLRKKNGDSIHFIDGEGGMYEGIIEDLGKKDCRINITEKKENFGKRDFKIHIAIAPTKNISRLEWFLEKTTEMGIDTITPILCNHSERKNIRNDRLEKVILSATKQSIKAYLPQLNDLTSFSDFLENVKDDQAEKFVCWVDKENIPLSKNYTKKKDVIILIGPEGDFSQAEVEMANSQGFCSVGLGESRLRTETAGIVACHYIHVLNEL
ncbi:MAG: 16S rRNA (uracil(1498)-N(3))-methyltransferase [Saprospiraceae bacterium]